MLGIILKQAFIITPISILKKLRFREIKFPDRVMQY